MRFACLTTIAPGSTLAAKCAAIAEAGCTGIETIVFPDTPLEAWQAEVRHALVSAELELAVVIVGGLKLYEADGLAWARAALQAIAELGAAALITPEYRAQEPLPLFPPYPPPPADEQAQVETALAELGALAVARNIPLLLEPLTQFESRFWRDVPTVARMCTRLAHPLARLALDTHNMNMTEANIQKSIAYAGSLVGHVHLADNNRRLPGEGQIDFAGLLAALQAISYDGWYSFECAVAGNFVTQVRAAMRYLRGL
ncbi:MAG: sugar phosphate isomerase/epimerase [Roseiflexaceae bacterium]|nr:sugar phosphate isomerase/epimerase [Roseiflexaceae bacterium]